MKYTTILFDADETLLDFRRSEREAVAEAFACLGVAVDNDMLDEYSRINAALWKKLERKEIEKSVLLYKRFEIFFDKYGFRADAKAMAKEYLRTLSQRAYLLNGAEKLCERLSGKARMYIVTNGVRANQESRLSKCGLLKYFDGVFISEATGFEKPQVEFFEYVAERIPDFSKDRAIIVGDSLSSDIKGGINFGIDTCWYAPSGADAPEDIKDSITYTVRDFDGIYEALTKGEK